MSGGIETKVDTKSVQLGKLLVLENGTFERPGKVRKRNGYDSLGNAIAGGGTIDSAVALSANQNTGQLVILGQDRTYGYSEVKSSFIDIGPTYTASLDADLVADSYYLENNTAVGMTIIGGYEVYAYLANYYGFPTSMPQTIIRDTITKNILYSSSNNYSLVAAIKSSTKIVSDGTYAYQMRLTWDGTDQIIYVDKIDPTLTSPIVATLTITIPATNSLMTRAFDLIYTPLGLAIVYQTTMTNLRVRLYDTSFTLLQTADTVIPIQGCGAAALAYESTNQNIFVFRSNDNPSKNLSFQVFSSTLAVVLANTTINSADEPWQDAVNSWNFSQITAIQTSPDHITVLATAEYPTANANVGTQDKIAKYGVSSTAVLFEDSNFCLNGNLYSQLVEKDSKVYVVTGYNEFINDSGQSTFYLNEVTESGMGDVNTFGNVARLYYGSAYTTRIGDPQLMSAPIVRGTTLVMALPQTSSLAVKSSTNIISLSRVIVDFNDSVNSAIVTVPDTNFFSSLAQPISIDEAATEESFNQFPEAPVLTEQAGGLLTLLATYQVFLVYEWVDTKGQVHQSSPSVPTSITLTGANAQITAKIFIPVRTTKRTPIKIVAYLTNGNGVTPYRYPVIVDVATEERYANVGSTVNLLLNDADTTMANNQILYTTGGILANDPAPNSKFQWLYKNRVMLGGLDDGNTIWYSKTRVAGEPIKFSALFYTNVDIAGGDVLAGGTLDDKCIFFKRNKIFYMYGDGPNDAGGGQAFSIPQEISSPVGCAYPKSVVAMPLGLMFKSEKGIFLLDRGLNVSYKGSPVADANDNTITSAIHLGQYNQVVFTLDNGTALFYDYLVDQWGTYTNISAISSTLFENQHTYIQSGGVVKQQGGLFLDAGTLPIELKIGLPWIKLAGLSGFERAKQLMLVGENISAHTLSVSMSYDFDPTVLQTADFTSNDPVLQERIFLTRQKCEAVQITITDNATSTSGEGYSLSELGILIGMKKGFFKVPSTKSTA